MTGFQPKAATEDAPDDLKVINADHIDKVRVGEAPLYCASCGIKQSDDVKLKQCDDCDLVRYCSDACQQLHRPEHEALCKERAAELRDEILFRQPECSHLGDCPICFLPLSTEPTKHLLMGCCSNFVCIGCDYANLQRERKEKLDPTCPFCRHPSPRTREEAIKNAMKGAKRNDPVALQILGKKCCNEGDVTNAFKYFVKAAELGDASAHYHLVALYNVSGVGKDKKKQLYHLEEAAIVGHPAARFNLAVYEEKRGRYDRAVKHLIIAANLGDLPSIQAMKALYKDGQVSKDDFAAALRAYQDAVDEAKSPQREVGEKAMASIYNNPTL